MTDGIIGFGLGKQIFIDKFVIDFVLIKTVD